MRIRFWVVGLIRDDFPRPLRTRETVDFATPAALATSKIVTGDIMRNLYGIMFY